MLSCHRDPDLFLMSLLCPYMHSCNERFVDERNDAGCICCAGYLLGCGIGAVAWNRAKVRSLMGLPDEPWIVDCCAACCCHPCAIAQSARAMRSVRLNNRLSWRNPLGVAPTKPLHMTR